MAVIEWSANTQAGGERDICDQQATPKQADLALVACQVCLVVTSCTGFMTAHPCITLARTHSGPKRYDYSAAEDQWVYYRDGQSMGDLLEREISYALDRDVKLGLKNVSHLVD